MDIKDVLLTNYLPYAKGVIIGRAIPSIDGLKPAQRRILYTMYRLGLLKGAKAKSSKVVGQTMAYHPHGDMAIYETMVRMSTGHEALNVPYIESKGNFGKVYSDELKFAAPRYTQSKLAEICNEMFDGLDDGAVDMINNFDDTEIEPTLLPVKFPSIIVNTSSGIAVGRSSSNIPSFDLVSSCKATVGLLDGTITDVEGLMKVLGTPEFTTGGCVHASDKELINLGKTGRGSFTVSGSVVTYPNSIVIYEIPYKTTAESITHAIEAYAKSGELREVSDVSDEIDLKGFKLVIELKRGADSKKVLDKICRLTNLRMNMSFITRVIVNDRCEDFGIYELLEQWIDFRLSTIKRINQFRLDKATTKSHLLESWEKISVDISTVAKQIASSTESETREKLSSLYGLDNIQINYILSHKISGLNKDNVAKKIRELEALREESNVYRGIIGSDKAKRDIAISDLNRIADKYGSKRKTIQADLIVESTEGKEEVIIDDSMVNVIITKSGYIKRLVSLRDIDNFELPEGEEILYNVGVKNNDSVLVFTYDGECHKILVDSIDASRGGLKDTIGQIIHMSNTENILYIDFAGDYSGYFNIVYPNGRGVRVHYSKASGKRDKYISLYEGGEIGYLWITKAEKFFMITARRKAAYCDLSLMGVFSTRVAFKVARVANNDCIYGLQPVDKVPDIDSIDIGRYSKPYTVSIGKDELWEGANTTVKTEDTVEDTVGDKE